MVYTRRVSVLVSQRLRNARNFTASRLMREVQLFNMPSMSPTMEEGGIVEWKVKAGDTFSSGDVLLEIETDKAEISVEAADDGVLVKLLEEAGAKGIPVGKPIAVLAEPGDDINVDVDALIKSASASAPKKPASSESREPAAPPAKTSESASSKPASTPEHSSVAGHANQHGKHGLDPLPTAVRLLHEHNLNASDIKGSGPFGRITKGDVLAHLGKIPKDYPTSEQSRIEERMKLDLSNIKVATSSPSSSQSGSDGAEAGSSSAKSEAPSKPKPKPIVTSVSIPLTPLLVGKINAAKQKALRLALLSLKPKPSVLRNAAFDLLTASTKPPFVVKKSQVVIIRGRPVSLDVSLEEPPAPVSSKAVNVYIDVLKSELASLDG